jgi:polar amino acid transport system substrate-binding protein
MHLCNAQLARTAAGAAIAAVLTSVRSLVARSLSRMPLWLMALACAALATASAWLLLRPGLPQAHAGPAPAARQVPQGQPGWAQLRIGVAAAAMPLVSATRNYTEEGHELTLARALGERLGAAPQFVALAPQDVAAALADGRVDAVLTRQPPAGLQAAGIAVLDSGYRAGIAAAMRSDTPLRDWKDLRGRKACVAHAHARAQPRALQAGAALQLVDAPAQGLALLRSGACDAALHDADQLQALFERKEWHKFSATLPTVEPAALVLLAASARPRQLQALRRALASEGTPQAWRARNARWAANVAYEVYFDQIGPDCH